MNGCNESTQRIHAEVKEEIETSRAPVSQVAFLMIKITRYLVLIGILVAPIASSSVNEAVHMLYQMLGLYLTNEQQTLP